MAAATTASAAHVAHRCMSAADAEAAAASKGADMTSATSVAATPATPATTASTTLHELDHAGRALEVKGGSCLRRQLRRRHQGQTARQSSYRHRIPHREFSFHGSSVPSALKAANGTLLPVKMPASAHCSDKENSPARVSVAEALPINTLWPASHCLSKFTIR
jgi:hypothetical protein